jgi:competence protein ComEA
MFRKLFVSLLAALALNAWAAVDVNRASQADLETVKGIGPGLSAKILKAREAGAFKDWADMVGRVGGIGAGNAAKFSQAGLTVGGSPFDPATISVPAKAAKPTAAKSPVPAAAPAGKRGRKAE